jgi:hypothetical protein
MLDPIVYTLPEARRVSGHGLTKLYQLIGAGVLDARKAGSRTLVTAESLRRYLDNLPPADIRTGRKAAA